MTDSPQARERAKQWLLGEARKGVEAISIGVRDGAPREAFDALTERLAKAMEAHAQARVAELEELNARQAKVLEGLRGELARARAENTRHVAEVERLKRSRLRWRSVAYDKNAALVAALRLNTPLRAAMAAAEELLSGWERESRATLARHRPQPSNLNLAPCVCEDCVPATDRLAYVEAIREALAVTGTTSDNAPFRQLAPDECPACRVRGLSLERLGGACHALECPNPTAWLRARVVVDVDAMLKDLDGDEEPLP